MLSRKNWILSSALAVVLSGCGLRDYEKRMAYEQERLAYIEKENELLGPPVSFAARKPVTHPEKSDKKLDKKKKQEDQPAPTPNLFLRLPKELKSTGKEIAPESLVFAFSAVKGQPTGTIQVAYVAQGSHEAFTKRVQTELRTAPNISAPEFKSGPQRTETLLQGPPLVFETFVASDADRKFTMFVYSGPGDKTAIVLGQAQVKDSAAPANEDEVAYCLRSLAVGGRVAAARQAYHAP